ncbi:hypothetical protein [Niabella hibiscisoli]|uniref:hypothetical protein n=1 Tax=Niabella hibiscisoli TaxID=1825928 RepID=UPI001F0EF8FC|nr:hypothetical protein [Niabella hibiscisoli]MCH5719113.1 hypothetical protein [Niabella hibiscisoli]
MRPFFLLFFLILAIEPVVLGQKNDAKPAAVHSRSLDISRSRSILLDKFLEKDQLGVMLELDRITMLEDDDYIALYPIEFWLLSYWLGDYEVILSSCKNLNTDSIAQYKNQKTIRIPPQQDYLAPKLLEKSLTSKDSLINQINAAYLSEEEKGFLRLNLAYLLPEQSTPERHQEVLNQMSDDFLTRYPGSDYADFTREFVRIQYKETRNGGSYSFYTGKFLFTGNLTDYYKQPTLFGLAFDIVRNNWIYQLNIAISFTKTKTEMTSDNDIWPEKSKALGGYANLALGKYLIDTKTLALAPSPALVFLALILIPTTKMLINLKVLVLKQA